MLVFVYGTLKNGYCNHSVLGDSSGLGGAVTVDEFHMCEHAYPFLVESSELLSKRVRGEVYDVSPAVLGRLDRLEGVPRLYVRKFVDVELDGGGVVRAAIYLRPSASG